MKPWLLCTVYNLAVLLKLYAWREIKYKYIIQEQEAMGEQHGNL